MSNSLECCRRKRQSYGVVLQEKKKGTIALWQSSAADAPCTDRRRIIQYCIILDSTYGSIILWSLDRPPILVTALIDLVEFEAPLSFVKDLPYGSKFLQFRGGIPFQGRFHPAGLDREDIRMAGRHSLNSGSIRNCFIMKISVEWNSWRPARRARTKREIWSRHCCRARVQVPLFGVKYGGPELSCF